MTYDTIIIGAGPGGLSAAIYLGRAHQKVLVIYAGPRRTAHAVHIQNYLGFEDITGEELIDRGMKQAQLYGVEFTLATVKSVKKENDIFEITTASETFSATHVVVASGIDDVMPEIDNAYEFLGESFFTCLDCDGYHLFGKHACVIAGDESAAWSAIKIIKKNLAAKITLVNQQRYLMSEELKKLLEETGIAVIEKKPRHLVGKNGILSGVRFDGGSELVCDFVLARLGYTRNDSFLEGLSLNRSETGYLKIDRNYESSIKGLFVVGPLNTGPDQVSVAVGEGAQAAMKIIWEE